jgi:L-ribulokinase
MSGEGSGTNASPRAAKARYSIGVDFGTESGRVLLLDVGTGVEAGVAVVRYASGAIDRLLPETGEALPSDWALQDPDDWRSVIETGIPQVLEMAGVDGRQVIGIGIDFTCCTVLPVTADGTPLCSLEQWRARPHAWPKLWKHHAAQSVADRLNEVARERDEPFLKRYGGKISSEWYFPKLIELWLEDREVYDAMVGFIEACDWIVWHLSGTERRAACSAGYKAMWSPDVGLPPNGFFKDAYQGFDSPAEKLGSGFFPLGGRAGTLRPELAQRLGLSASVAIAVGNVDSFVSVPGAGVLDATSFLIVIGTSICDVVVHPEEILLPGITGVVKDGVLPGFYGYEAGQAAVGDMLAWFVGLFGAGEGGDRYSEFERDAARLRPGGNGLLALDWWNGNRTILADADLSGVLCGMTLHTTAAEIYRALLESIAFGNRRIVDNFEAHGLQITQLVACGGIAEKSPLTMQLLADTSGRRLLVPGSTEIPARGAALFGAVAAGPEVGGFVDIMAAIDALSPGTAATYDPSPASVEVYEQLYPLYCRLHDTLGQDQVDLLHELKRIRERGAPRVRERDNSAV